MTHPIHKLNVSVRHLSDRAILLPLTVFSTRRFKVGDMGRRFVSLIDDRVPRVAIIDAVKEGA